MACGCNVIITLQAVPGLLEAGWQAQSLVVSGVPQNKDALNKALVTFTEGLLHHDDSWPFREPVDISIIQDYVTVVKTPIGT
jgi:hypothetical protein